MKILVIQPAFIGDAIISLSLAEAIIAAEPMAEIYYLVRPESKALLTYSPAVKEVLVFDKYNSEAGKQGIERKAAELNTYKFDAVCCLHESLRTIELLKRLTIPIKIGNYQHSVFTHSILSNKTEDRAMQAAKLATALFPEAKTDVLAKLTIPDSLLPSDMRSLPRLIACLAPGSVWKTKRWPAASFIALAETLAQKGYSIVLIGLKTDISDEIEGFDRAPITHKKNYLSALSLEATAAVIAYSDILISNDSAPVHIAIATGTPVVDIFGPTVSEFGFAPRSANGVSIEVNTLWCRPCSAHGSNECPIHTHECMTAISTEDVLHGIKRIVGR